MECDVCGSHNVSRRRIEDALVEECNLCGNLQGDDDAVQTINDLRTGRTRGLDDAIIPLVYVLEGAHVFRVVKATAGWAEGGEPPALFFTLTQNDTIHVERLLRSLELANRETHLRWLIELSLQHEIVYILRPRFWKPAEEISPEEIRLARSDLQVLASRLRRDLALSWWRD